MAKWITVVLAAGGVLALVWSAAQHTLVRGAPGILSVFVVVLQIVAASLLFRADTRAWFGSGAASGPTIRSIDWPETDA